jgi:hypothetical protein
MTGASRCRLTHTGDRPAQKPAQIEPARQLREWCANAGHKIVREYVEHVSGGKGKEQRQRFAAMLNDAHRRGADNRPPSAACRRRRPAINSRLVSIGAKSVLARSAWRNVRMFSSGICTLCQSGVAHFFARTEKPALGAGVVNAFSICTRRSSASLINC